MVPFVSLPFVPVECLTPTGQTLYAVKIIDPTRADAILHNGRFRFGAITELDEHYLLTQGDFTWCFEKHEAQIVMFNLSPCYRKQVEQIIHAQCMSPFTTG